MLLNRFLEAWSARDAGAVAECFTPDGVRHQLALPEARLAGRDAVREGVGLILNAVPDARLDPVASYDTTDGAVLEWLFAGTLENDLPGLPANGAPVHLPGVSVCRLDENGLIEEERVYWDGATLMAVAGLLG